jgi:hypothetical protein
MLFSLSIAMKILRKAQKTKRLTGSNRGVLKVNPFFLKNIKTSTIKTDK